jgi:hypothetical protein
MHPSISNNFKFGVRYFSLNVMMSYKPEDSCLESKGAIEIY